MQYDNEVKFDKERKSKKALKTVPLSISATVPHDQTLSFGDWKILEPGNFGTQPHFAGNGNVIPSLLPTESKSTNSIIENNYYRTHSILSTDTTDDLNLT